MDGGHRMIHHLHKIAKYEIIQLPPHLCQGDSVPPYLPTFFKHQRTIMLLRTFRSVERMRNQEIKEINKVYTLCFFSIMENISESPI